MKRNILEYLEEITPKFLDKNAFVDEEGPMTFSQLLENAKRIGSYLCQKGLTKKPIIVFMEKSSKTIATFLGCVYASDYYIPIDAQMPKLRIELILQKVNSPLILCDEKTMELAKSFAAGAEVVLYETACKAYMDEEALKKIRLRAIDTDPIYIVFTSGSTGIPKGVVACHRSVIDYVESFTEVMAYDENTIFGNQSPLYFDACLKEIFSTLKYGGTTYLIPKALFMFPYKLVEYLNDHKINAICWVVSALTMISSCDTFEEIKPKYLKKIAFGSEVFPTRQLSLWREAVPDADYVNLYGPTEATGMSCFYRLPSNKEFTEAIPIGKPFRNTDIFLLNEKGEEALEGEICIRGTCVTLGYYKDSERTEASFVQNPLHNLYPELIYRTGDLAKWNEDGELVFLSRKDYQIKHMGHRIELGEIEANVNCHEAIRQCACIYDEASSKIVLYYVGDLKKAALLSYLKERVPSYMLPNYMEAMESMPFTANGKLDRVALKQKYQKRNA